MGFFYQLILNSPTHSHCTCSINAFTTPKKHILSQKRTKILNTTAKAQISGQEVVLSRIQIWAWRPKHKALRVQASPRARSSSIKGLRAWRPALWAWRPKETSLWAWRPYEISHWAWRPTKPRACDSRQGIPIPLLCGTHPKPMVADQGRILALQGRLGHMEGWAGRGEHKTIVRLTLDIRQCVL